MSQTENTTQQDGREQLRRSPMMAHLLDALEKGTDVGHYGRLTFTMVARHFLSDDEMIALLSHQPEQSEASARVESTRNSTSPKASTTTSRNITKSRSRRKTQETINNTRRVSIGVHLLRANALFRYLDAERLFALF